MNSVLMITVRADWGGGPKHIYHLLENLRDKMNFFVACPNDFPYWHRYKTIVQKQQMFKIPHRKFNILLLWRLRSFVKKNRIELIHSHGKGAGIYGRLLSLITNIPCIHTFHGVHLKQYNLPKRKTYILIERWLCRLSARIITVSYSEAKQIKKLNLCNTNKLHCIPNGVRFPPKHENPHISQTTDNSQKQKIIHITGFDYAKNFELLLKIWEIIDKDGLADKFQIIILGDGKNKQRFQKDVENRNWQDNFLFLGGTENVNEYLLSAFCYLSTSRWEGMPLAVLEAMAAGLPVIATDVVGNKDVVDNGKTGFLYNPGQPQEAIAYLTGLANDGQRWQALSREACDKVQRDYSVEHMAKQTAKLYEIVLSER